MISGLEALKEYQWHTMMCWNSRSVVNNIEELERLVILANPEYIGICESWMNSNIDTQEIDICGYSCHRANRTENTGTKTGWGTLIYYKDQLPCSPQDQLTVCTPDVELSWVKLSLTNTRPIYIGVTYRPPSGNVAPFLNELESVATLL